jgi:CBS domain-containing protein
MEQILGSLEQRIQRIHNFEQLRLLRDEIQIELHDRLLFSSTEAWVTCVNAVHDRIIQKTVSMAEDKLNANGANSAPVPYAFILFGSGGRSEQTLWSDQDNGIIYTNDIKSAASDKSYFEQLAIRIEDGLRIVGYPPCEGGVVASNNIWCKSAEAWELMLGEWFYDASWESVRQLLIVADSRCLYGDQKLVDQLKINFDQFVRNKPGSIEALLKNTLRHKVVLGPFGNLIREPYGEDAGGFDIKYGVYIPFVNAIRLLSVKYGIHSTSSLERLDRLTEYIDIELCTEWRVSFEYILLLRSMTTYQLEDGYYSSRGMLSALDLNKDVANKLKDCLRVGEQLQKFIKRACSAR